jgi:hypothetical protein
VTVLARRALAVALPAVCVGTIVVLALAPAPATGAPTPALSAAPNTDDLRQAALVQAEDDRLVRVRAVAAVAVVKGGPDWSKPYRLDTGTGYTLVLTQRSDPYQIADLLELAPQTFIRQADGAYLLTENIFVTNGAALRLSNAGGLTIRMASNSNGFVSIVSFGGGLTIAGTEQAPTTITSWDPRANRPDTDVTDGRAYVRAIGGTFTMTYATLSDLGFWSGRTGGLSLTGTDRPDVGAIGGPEHLTKHQRQTGKAKTPDGPAKSVRPPEAGGVLAQPSGDLTSPDTRFDLPGLSYISVRISHAVLRGNAFGLFVSSAQGISIADTTVEQSLEDGLVMHRGASSAVIERTISRGNGGDGFVLSRATQQVRVSASTSENNRGNGFTLSGQPLATGPSASGESTAAYGSNSVSNSTARDNGHYGIEILGGIDVGIQNNTVDGSDMGIVARQGGADVAITGNQLHNQQRHGIAVRDGISGAVIAGNLITGAETGVYVRDSSVEVRGNIIQEATSHGITLVGDVDGSSVSYNTIDGMGSSAIEVSRSHGKVTDADNQTLAWFDTRALWRKVRHYTSPMTMLWTTVILVILFSAIRRGSRHDDPASKSHPYADTMPLDPPSTVEVGPRRGGVAG